MLIRPALLAALCLAAGPALASSHKAKFDALKHGDDRGASSTARDCPPGLAKKTPSCIPPGQAKKDTYAIGDRLDRDERLSRHYDDLDLPLLDDVRYYRTDDTVYRVDPDTRAILDAIAIAGLLLN